MIRKIIIGVLTLAAVGVAVPVISGAEWLHWPDSPGDEWLLWSDSRLVNRIRVGDRQLTIERSRIVSDVEFRAIPVSSNPVLRSYGVRVRRHIELLGFRWSTGAQKRDSENRLFTRIVIPLWMPFVLLAPYPTIAFIRGPLRRYRRRKRGLCVTCGYDLRGSPDRCPECGTEIERT